MVGVSPDGNFSATQIASGRVVDLGRVPVETNLEPVAVRRPLAGRQLRRAGRGTIPVALDLEAALR